jgi:hypothetical protein
MSANVEHPPRGTDVRGFVDLSSTLRSRPLYQVAQLVRMLLALRETLRDQIADLHGQLIRQANASRS